MWTLIVYEHTNGTVPYAIFRNGLNIYSSIILDICIEEILARQGNNVCTTSWGKNLGQGLYEFRVNRSLASICNEAGIEVPTIPDANSVLMLRVFFAVEGQKIVLLLWGYDKGKDVSSKRQQREIVKARRFLTAHKNRIDK